jgi:hypothetical protein
MPNVSVTHPTMMPFLTQISNRFFLAKNASKLCRTRLLGFYFLLNLTGIAQLNNHGGAR